jgi:phosphoheptose isomerase
MWKRIVAPAMAAWSMPWVLWSQVPLGGEFQVNTYTTSGQGDPAVAAAADGSFMVVWTSYGLDGSSNGIFARRFDAAGTPVGASEFRVNSYTTGAQDGPDLAATPTGGFVVAWQSNGQDGSGSGIFAQRYDGSLLPQGGEFEVNTHTTTDQSNATVTSDGAGRFFVGWSGSGPYFSSEIHGRRYDSVGVAQGSQFRINTYVTGFQSASSAAADAAGNVVVVWRSTGQDGGGTGVFGQRFDAGGELLGADFAVNVYTTGNQEWPAVASSPSGDFVVVWQSRSPGEDLYGIFARRYDANGAPQGLPFQVNQYTTGHQIDPVVEVDGQGNFVVAWSSIGEDGSGEGVFARVFEASGDALAGEFLVNSYTSGNQRRPAVAIDPRGRFVVAWTSYNQDGDYGGVFAHRFARDLIFRDGFASASLSAWSSANTDGGDLSASALAAMKFTTVGLQGLVDDTAGLFVQDDTPDDENRYRARFYFDPNGFDPGESQVHLRTRIFIAFEEAPTRRLAAVVLRRQAGVYALMGRARLDDNSQENTGFVTISDGPHFVEIDWQRSSGPDALDGSFAMWIDGMAVPPRTGLDNSISSVDFVRVGALSVKSGAGGTMYWDEFESRRATYIGP